MFLAGHYLRKLLDHVVSQLADNPGEIELDELNDLLLKLYDYQLPEKEELKEVRKRVLERLLPRHFRGYTKREIEKILEVIMPFVDYT